jgi:acetoacetate decarboxylase
MMLEDVRKAAFAMPLTSPSYPVGPYRFSDREHMIICCRTDREALERIVPEPLEFIEGVVQYEVIRTPNSTGFGTYAGSDQVVPVRFRGEMGGYIIHAQCFSTPYATAKHGLIGLCRVVATEGAKHGVRANVVCPGFVHTPLVEMQLPEQANELGISEEEVVRNVMRIHDDRGCFGGGAFLRGIQDHSHSS